MHDSSVSQEPMKMVSV